MADTIINVINVRDNCEIDGDSQPPMQETEPGNIPHYAREQNVKETPKFLWNWLMCW